MLPEKLLRLGPTTARGTKTTRLSYICSGVSGLGSLRANSSGGADSGRSYRLDSW
jgi:hypothetical protein